MVPRRRRSFQVSLLSASMMLPQVQPGLTEFTRMFSAAKSVAMLRVT